MNNDTAQENRDRKSVDISIGERPGPREFDIEGLEQTGGISGYYGDEGVLKTYLAIHKATCQTLGLPYFRLKTVPRTIIYFDWERDEDEFKRRCWEVALGMNLDRPPHIYYLRLYKPLLSSIDVMRAEIKGRSADSIIIDSLSFAGVSTVETAIAASNALRSLGVSVTTYDHQAREQRGESYAQKDPYGTRFKEALYNNLWQIELSGEPDPNHPEVVDLLMRDKKFSGGARRREMFIRAVFKDSIMFARTAPAAISPALEEKLSNGKRVLRSLRRLGGSAIASEIADNTGLSKKAVQEELSRAKRRGIVTDIEGEKKTDSHTWKFVSDVAGIEFEEDLQDQTARPQTGEGGGLATYKVARLQDPTSSSGAARLQDPLQEGELQDVSNEATEPEGVSSVRTCLTCGDRPEVGSTLTCEGCLNEQRHEHQCADCDKTWMCLCQDPDGYLECRSCRQAIREMEAAMAAEAEE